MNEVLDIILTNLKASRRIPQFFVDGCLLEDTADGIFFMYDIMSGVYAIDRVVCSAQAGSPIVKVLIDLK